jgi:cyclopropane fatty-acyl-phospholipid synthase-like methyltransferase
MPQKEWFATWFDSSYYHLLYQHRDDNEAKLFVQNLVAKLDLATNAHVLDLACGKGRHSITLAQMGYSVVGADLAPNSIAAAETARTELGLEKLHFLVHDMRKPLTAESFAAVFNLFTSFGYFDTLAENQAVCKSIAAMLQPDGLLIIDFLNAHKVCANLKATEYIEREGIGFQIKRWHSDAHIFKQIEVVELESQQSKGKFTERVQALTFADFSELLSPYFDLIETYGSYQLSPFDVNSSDRLILIAKKKS